MTDDLSIMLTLLASKKKKRSIFPFCITIHKPVQLKCSIFFKNLTVVFQPSSYCLFCFFPPAKMLSVFREDLAVSSQVAMVASAWPAGSVSRCQTWPPTWNCDRDNRRCVRR